MKIVEQSVELVTSSIQPTKLIEQAGRTCYKSKDKITDDSADRFVRARLTPSEPGDIPHESIIEHAVATFRIVCDRGVSHEIVRHRIGFSYSQESTRYCNYGKNGRHISVIKPPGLRTSEDDANFPTSAEAAWVSACTSAEGAYLDMVRNGIPVQIARSVLPTCLKTEIVVTANFRAWRNFLRQRLSKKAHPQMRDVARMIADHLIEICPACFEEFKQ